MIDETVAVMAIPARADTTRRRISVVERVRSLDQVGVAFLLLLLIGWGASPDFLTVTNIRNLLSQTSILGILAIGQFLVVLVGGFDLSVAAVLALGSVIIGQVVAGGYPLWLAALAALAAGVCVGSVSGMAATIGRVPPMIATLGTAGIARGLALVIAPKSVLIPESVTGWLQIDFGVVTTTTLAWGVTTMLLAFLLGCTRTGRHLYAVGGNERSARLAGIRVIALKISAYALSGALSGLAGLLFVIRSSSGVPHVGTGWDLETIAGIVIGGARLSGGEGNVFKAMIGMLIYGMIGNIMNLVAINPYYQDIVKAAVVVAVVGFSALQIKRRRGV